MCNLNIMEDGLIKSYSCEQVKLLEGKWKHDFRIRNKSDMIRVDKYYDAYCKEIDDFLGQCTCQIPMNCEKCLPEEHEGNFCRCESRNILIAKQLRRERFT